MDQQEKYRAIFLSLTVTSSIDLFSKFSFIDHFLTLILRNFCFYFYLKDTINSIAALSARSLAQFIRYFTLYFKQLFHYITILVLSYRRADV